MLRKKPLSLGGYLVHAARVKASDFFALPASLAPFAAFFPADAAPWAWLKAISPALAAHRFDDPMPQLPPGVHVEGLDYLHPTVKLPPTALVVSIPTDPPL